MERSNSKDRFNPLWLVTFYWVCRFKKKQKAAGEMHVDPGTITYRIDQLEKAWGKKLIDPTLWVGCEITPFGKWLYRLAKLEYLAQKDQRKARAERFLLLKSQQSKKGSQQGHR